MHPDPGSLRPTPLSPLIQPENREKVNHKNKEKKMKTIFQRIAGVIAAPFTIIGLLVYLLVAYTEGEYDPYE